MKALELNPFDPRERKPYMLFLSASHNLYVSCSLAQAHDFVTANDYMQAFRDDLSDIEAAMKESGNDYGFDIEHVKNLLHESVR